MTAPTSPVAQAAQAAQAPSPAPAPATLDAPPAPPPARRARAPLGLLAIVVVAYAPTLKTPFVWDDLPHILAHPALDGGDLGAWVFGGTQETRPLLNASYWLCAQLFGADPLGWHAFNVAAHAATVLALRALLRALGRRCVDAGALDAAGRDAFAFWSAALFAAHPLATEAVTYVNSRSVVLATLGMLLAYATLERARRSAGGRYGAGPLAFAAVAMLAIGLLAKEMAVTLPAVVLLVDALLAPRDARGEALTWRARLVGPALLSLALVVVPVLFATMRSPHTQHIGFAVLDPMRHALTQPIVLVELLAMLALPVGQSIDHDLALASGPLDPRTLAATAALALGLVASWRARRAAPAAAIALPAFLIVMAPTNSVVPFYDYFCERHLYPGIAVVATGAGWALARALGGDGPRRRMRLAAAALVVGALGGLTFARNTLWQDPRALWHEAATRAPLKARPAAQLGAHLARAGQLEAARPWLERAVRQAPEVQVWRANLGLLYRLSGAPDAELALWQARVAAAPADTEAQATLQRLLKADARRRRAPPATP